MRTTILFSLLVLATFSVRAADYEPPWAKLRDLAAQYLEHCVKPDDLARRHKKFRALVEQRLSENDSMSEDNIMRSIMLDWAAGAQKKIKKKERDAVAQACYYFVTFFDKGYDMPQQIRASLDEKAVGEIIEHFEEEIGKAKKS